MFLLPFQGNPVLAAVYLVLGVAVAALASLYLTTRRPRLNFPIVGDPDATDCRDALVEGAILYPDQPWVLPLQDPMVILPHSAVSEIKSLPEKQMSLNKELYVRFLGRYTLLGQDDDEMVSVIKHDLYRSLSDVFDNVLVDEAIYGVAASVGACKDWTPLAPFNVTARIITMLNGRTFVGLPLSRNEDWIHSTIAFTTEGDIVAQSLRPYPSLIRPVVAPFLPAVRSLKKHQALVSKKTQPLIEAHFARSASEKKDPNQSGRLLSWLLGKYKNGTSPNRIAKDYLLSSAASIPIPASLLTHILFELGKRPEYVEPLRLELRAAVEKNGGKFSYNCLGSLDKMDSFIKETQRLNSHGLIMMTRRTTAKFTMSDGTVIPKDVSVGVSNYGLNMSPTIHENPEEFRGFRFSDLRQSKPGVGARTQFVSTGLDNLNWGYGNHACPGRHFAAAEIKLTLAYLLSNYDLKLGDDGRPDNMIFGLLVVPNPFAKLLFKRRAPIAGLEL
ncbi:cytochrome P450 [Lophiotrema nucula]|uniref:Cytochrome P450 n=1 Tax=Lophiotrema nucula TaxID=690887 RepID=A0A6A5YGF5_9PLEO|nr:cytochrome P450 [Lophiotrema nucula]